MISSIDGEVFPENSSSKISLDNTKYCGKYRTRKQILGFERRREYLALIKPKPKELLP
jgi:hypothetical protein